MTPSHATSLRPNVRREQPPPSSAETRCSKCSAILDPKHQFCPACGTPAAPATKNLSEKPAPHASPVLSESAAAKAPAIKASNIQPESAQDAQVPNGFTQSDLCDCQCGAPLTEDAEFCSACGSAKSKPGPATYRLIIRIAGSSQRVVQDVDSGELLIGSAPSCDVRIPEDAHLSREHARLSVVGEQAVIEDLLSSNGTFVRVREPFLLRDGDELFVGTTLLRIERVPAGQSSC